MSRRGLFVLVAVAAQLGAAWSAAARAPSPDEQFRMVKEHCASFTQARIAQERAIGQQLPSPTGDDMLRKLIYESDATLNGVIQDMENIDAQLMANSQVEALPISGAVHRATAENICFARDLLFVRKQSGGTPPPSTPSAPAAAAAPVDPAIDRSVADSIAMADEGAPAVLERQYATPEPGPLGLQGAANVPDYRRPPAADRAEPVVEVRYLGGLQCMKVRSPKWEVNNEGNWHTEFSLENECGYEVLLRLDTAEQDEGETSPHSYTLNGGIVSVGVQGTLWPEGVKPPTSWTPNSLRGEGLMWRPYTSPKLVLVDSHTKRRFIVYIYACPLIDQATGRYNVLFIERQRLMDEGNRECFVEPPKADQRE